MEETGEKGASLEAAGKADSKKVEKKRQREQYVVEEMIRLYCRKNHSGSKAQLCPVCQKLADYAKLRSQKCPFMENKTFCANCKVHCYKPEMREKIRQVMRFSAGCFCIILSGLCGCQKNPAGKDLRKNVKTGGVLPGAGILL